jgi:hypothetical protein
MTIREVKMAFKNDWTSHFKYLQVSLCKLSVCTFWKAGKEEQRKEKEASNDGESLTINIFLHHITC